MRGRRWSRALKLAALLATALTVAFLLAAEIRTSWLQSELLSAAARSLTFHVEPGPSNEIRFPSTGPYDQRLGYVGLPGFVERLGAQGFQIERQARLAARHRDAIDRGAFAIYREKTSAGLAVLDRAGAKVFDASFPERIYGDDAAVPRLIVDTLLFIENRELLDDDAPRRNPAVEWDRLALVLRASLAKTLDPGHSLPGGSTLATQIEKYRHAPAGRTEDAGSKLRQMISASLRAYRDGPDTSAVRRQLVVAYLNSTPLSARAGFGEVNGLGDGLWAWFGTDFELANRVLNAPAGSPEHLLEQARLYRQVLSLLLAQRRPSHYLVAGRAALDRADRCVPAPARRRRGDPSRARASGARVAARVSARAAAAVGAAVRRAQGGQRHPHHPADAARPAGSVPARPAGSAGGDVARSAGSEARHRGAAAAERSARPRARWACSATACSMPARPAIP